MERGRMLMAAKGKNGKGKKGAGPADGGDQVIEFTPDAGFEIRHSARNFSQMMEDLGQPIIIHLPHVSVEFEPGCTPKEIIDGYNQAMKHKFKIKHSNSNATKPNK